MPVMAYIAFVWYFSAKFLLTRRDAAFEALVWWTQKKTGRYASAHPRAPRPPLTHLRTGEGRDRRLRSN